MRRIKAAVIGCGWVAHNIHLPYLRSNPDVEIVAICDKNKAIAQRASEAFNIQEVYEDYIEMIDSESPDLVLLTTPPNTHALMAIEAMKRGCNVLTEKPMALSIEEAKKVANYARDKKYCVAHQDLFLPVVQKTKHFVDKGLLGDILSVRTNDAATTKTFEDLGYLNVPRDHWLYHIPHFLIRDGALHTVTLQLAFLNDVQSVYVVGKKHRTDTDWAKHDNVTVILNSENEVGIMELSMNSPYRIFSMDICGTKMNLHLDLGANYMVKYKQRYGSIGSVLSRYGGSLQEFSGMTNTLFKYALKKHHLNIGHYILLGKFLESIKNDTPSPVSAEDGLKVMSIIESICEQIERQTK